nr:aldehyde dehydrogenase family protein [Pseudoduganella umbonata]
MGYERRQQYLEAYADALATHRDELARLLVLEQGKPLKTMAEPEVDQAISWIRQIAARRIPVEIVEETDSHIVELHHTPLASSAPSRRGISRCCWPCGKSRPHSSPAIRWSSSRRRSRR